MEQEQYEKIVKSILKKNENSDAGKMFGKECLKINGKAFAAFHQKKMVFKLKGSQHEKALALKSSQLWDPSGKGRAMKEWVQVPFSHVNSWSRLATAALKYVEESNKS